MEISFCSNLMLRVLKRNNRDYFTIHSLLQNIFSLSYTYLLAISCTLDRKGSILVIPFLVYFKVCCCHTGSYQSQGRNKVIIVDRPHIFQLEVVSVLTKYIALFLLKYFPIALPILVKDSSQLQHTALSSPIQNSLLMTYFQRLVWNMSYPGFSPLILQAVLLSKNASGIQWGGI